MENCKMENKYLLFHLLFFLISISINAQTYRIASYVIGSGGGTYQTTSNKTMLTVGQPIIGIHYNSSNISKSGFWYRVGPFKMPPPFLTSPANNATNQDLSTTLQWQPVNKATSYIVQAATNNNFTNPILNYETNSTSYLLEGLAYNTTYYWRVKAKNSDQESNWSAIWQFTTKPEPLGIPTLTSPTNNATNVSVTPTLSWTSVANATQYDVQLWKKSNNQVIVNTTVNTTNHSGFNLDYSTEYEWKVRAKNAQQTGEWSSTFKFTTLPPTLPIVSTLDANNVTPTGATVGGNVTGGSGTITSRGIMWGTSQNNLNNTATSGSGFGAYTVNLTGLSPTTTYYYRAFATSQYGTGYGEIKSFTTAEAPPFTVSIGNKTACRNQGVYLGTDLVVEGGSGNFNYSWSPASLLDDATKANPLFINPTTTRTFTIAVKDNVSGVTITRSMTVTVPNPPTASVLAYMTRRESFPPFNLNSLVSSRSGIAPLTDKWYDANYNELASSIVDPPLGITKYYHRLIDGNGCPSQYKQTLIYTITEKDINIDNLVTSENATIAAAINPNPANDYINLWIITDNLYDLKISIVDHIGRIYDSDIIHQTTKQVNKQIDLSNLANGIYFIRIQNNESTATLTLMINH